ncbi:protein PDF [Phlebotomus papatasi]|uniref:protein PDF n=1 Tax=Phlebotomus papatasi TaxID=29031 RepID=UPI0024836A90|nr:protein PDF [Phlebotomus papatasi]
MPQNCANFARIFGILLAWQLLMHVCLAMPAMDDDNYYNKELVREFAPWMMAPVAYSQPENPCQTTYNLPENFLIPPVLHKRNSELINSLLSLPKTMNDAGK